MRDLILQMSMSLDGLLAGPNGEGDWVFATGSADGQQWKLKTVERAGVHAVGAKSFAIWTGFWRYATDIFAKPLNEIPKVVFSRHGRPPIAPAPEGKSASEAVLATWRDARVAGGPLADDVAALKREDGGPILVHGGATFAQALVRENLVDEYRLLVHPVALGRGPALFEKVEARTMLTLVECTRFDGGAVGLVYRRR